MLENSFQVSYTPNCTTQQSFLYKWKLDHTAMTGMFIATLTLIAKPTKHLQNPSLGDWINKLAVCLSIQWMRSSKRKWTTDSFNKTDEFVKKKKKPYMKESDTKDYIRFDFIYLKTGHWLHEFKVGAVC